MPFIEYVNERIIMITNIPSYSYIKKLIICNNKCFISIIFITLILCVTIMSPIMANSNKKVYKISEIVNQADTYVISNSRLVAICNCYYPNIGKFIAKIPCDDIETQNFVERFLFECTDACVACVDNKNISDANRQKILELAVKSGKYYCIWYHNCPETGKRFKNLDRIRQIVDRIGAAYSKMKEKEKMCDLLTIYDEQAQINSGVFYWGTVETYWLKTLLTWPDFKGEKKNWDAVKEYLKGNSDYHDYIVAFRKFLRSYVKYNTNSNMAEERLKHINEILGGNNND